MQNNLTQCKFSPTTLWFTGLSGAGKTTLANEVNARLITQKFKTVILDGDVVRRGLNADLGFSKEDRCENIRRFGEVAKLFRETGILNLVCVISPFEIDRKNVRSLTGSNEKFIEIFVDCPIEECERRDPKGLYKKALSGEISDFTGISSPYEKPLQPEINIRTDKMSVEDAVDQIMEKLGKFGII